MGRGFSKYELSMKSELAERLHKRIIEICRADSIAFCVARGHYVQGINAEDEAIFIGDEAMSGPNLEMEARLIRFYVVICKQYIVPMLGRISHISLDDSKEVGIVHVVCLVPRASCWSVESVQESTHRKDLV